jgi:nitrate reductase cytochrome c-type subunit
LTPAGNRGKVETPETNVEEARIPPRGKQVPVAERNGPLFIPKTINFMKTTLNKDRVKCLSCISEYSIINTDIRSKYSIFIHT